MTSNLYGLQSTYSDMPANSYNNVYNNSSNYLSMTPGTGAISSDPLYISTVNGSENFHLKYNSPSIGTGETNPLNQSMGAYGIYALPTSSNTSVTTTYRIIFPLKENFSSDGKIIITFPAGFDVSGCSASGNPGSTVLDGNFGVTVYSPTSLAITRGGGTTVVAGGLADISFSGVINSGSESEHKLSLELQDGSGNILQRSEDSNNFMLSDANPPGTITNLTGAGTAVEGEARLNWTAPGDDGYTGTASRYKIRYQTSASFDWNTAVTWNDNLAVGGAAGFSETTLLTGLTKETTYYFAIRTLDDKGNESPTASTIMYLRDLTPPGAINNLTTVSNGWGGQIELSWSSPGDDGGSGDIANGQWRIKHSTDSAYPFNLSDYQLAIPTNCLLGSTQKYTVTGLAGGKTYYFRVWARDNDSNWSAVSNSANAATALVRRLVFTSPPLTVQAGSYSQLAATVQLQDENNSAINVSQTEILAFTSSSTQGKFSLDRLVMVQEATLVPGENSASFYYYDTLLGTPTVTVKHKTANWYAGTQTETVTFVGLDHFKVDCAASGEVGIGRAVTVSARDIYNNTVSSYTGTVNLSNDGNMVLPSSLSFTAADQGVKIIQGIDYYVEKAKITALESTNSNIRGESLITDWAGLRIVPVDLAPASINQGWTGIGMVKLILATSSGSGTISGIKVQRGGNSVSDTDITLVKLYRDNGDGEFRPAGDILISSRPFSLGIAQLDGFSEAFNEQTKIYYLAYDINLNADTSKTIGLKIPDISYLTVSGRKIGMNNFPINSKDVLISHSLRTMELLTESKTKPELPQGARNTVIEKYSVRAASGTINWAGMKLSLSGSGSESDVETVKFYRQDSFGDTTLDVDGGVQASLVSSALMTSGAATLNFTVSETVTETTQYYYLTYDLSNIAKAGATLGASGSDTDFDLGADAVDKTDLPYNSDLGLIIPTVDTLMITPADLMPAQIKQGNKTRAMARLRLQTSANGVVLRSIKVKKIGTLPDSAVTTVKIYRADVSGTGFVDIGGGTTAAVRLVSSGTDTFINGETSLSLVNSEIIDTGGRDFYLLAELSEEAGLNETFGIKIDTGSLSVDEPDLLDNTGLPFETKAAVLVDNPDSLTFTGTDLAAGKSAIQGREYPVLKLTASVNQDNAEINKIKIKKLGSCRDSDIEKIKVVLDEDGNGQYTSADLLLSGGSDQFVNGEVKIALNKPEAVSKNNKKTFFLVFCLSLNAEAGKTIGAEISDLSYLEVVIPDKVENLNFPIVSSTVGIKDGKTPTTPVITDDGLYTSNQTLLHARWTAQVFSGSIGESFYAVGTSSSTTDVVGWTALANGLEVTRSGLFLQNGITCYFSVKVRSSLGDYWSDTGVSDGITVDAIKPQLKEKPKVVEVLKKGPLNDVTIQLPAAESGISGITQYEIQQREVKSPVWKTIKIVLLASLAGKNSVGGADSSLGYLVEGVLSGTYQYRVRVQNGAGVTSDWLEMDSPVIVGDLPSELLTEVSNYPNPFDSRKTVTTINYTLNQQASIKITIYDLLGYFVREINTAGNPGSSNNIYWDGTDGEGRKVTQGMYLAVIEAEGADGSKTKVVRRIGVVR